MYLFIIEFIQTYTACRDVKTTTMSRIANTFRQLIYQPASHTASHIILTSYLHIVHVSLNIDFMKIFC